MIHALKNCFIRTAAFLLFLVLFAGFLVPGAAQAEEREEVVRVGWYDSVFNRTDQFGRTQVRIWL